MNRPSRLLALPCVAVLLLGCGDADPRSVPVGNAPQGDGDSDVDDNGRLLDPPPERTDPPRASDAEISEMDVSLSDAGLDGGLGAATDAMTGPACGEVDCGLNGDCVIDTMTGEPACVCDTGYLADPEASGALCVEDTSCVEVSMIECRTSSATGSAVGMTVSATYCSGSPVNDLSASDLELQEMGADDWEVAGVESSLIVRKRDYIAHVYLVVDLSASVVTSGVLPPVRAGIEAMLDELEGSSLQTRVAVMLFDGAPTLYEFQSETADLSVVRARLSDLETFETLDTVSTDLYGATVRAINGIRGSVERKYLTHELGLYATKTVVIVSDGDDEAGRFEDTFALGVMDGTSAQVITVGLGDEADIVELTALGRDGSYAAPTEARVVQAFTEIGQRVAEYPESLHFIGYCSPKRSGSTSARVRLVTQDVTSPECAFSAADFGGGCSPDVFDPDVACGSSGLECGGILGCGTCPGGKACLDGACVVASGSSQGDTCGSYAMCQASLNCVSGACGPSTALDQDCSAPAPACDQRTSYCDGGDMCVALLADDEVCGASSECESRLCAPLPGRGAGSMTYCLPAVRMYDSCQGSKPCQPGSYCAPCGNPFPAMCVDRDDSVCMPVLRAGRACTGHGQCLSGGCVASVCRAPTGRFLSTAP